MDPPRITLYFDFVDPLSYLLDLELSGVESSLDVSARRLPFELRPPPEPLQVSADPFWVERLAEARPLAERRGLDLRPPRLVPWTRKAHELNALAAEHGQEAAARLALFRAYFGEGRDIGRVDVLVEIGTALGLDRTEVKATLDVDRLTSSVEEARGEATSLDVTSAPTLEWRGRIFQGFRNESDLSTLLGGAPPGR